MPDYHESFVPASPPPLTVRHTAPVALHLHAEGATAADDVRQMCSGVLPQVGERYVWVCTAVHRGPGQIDVQFQLVPLALRPREEDSPDAPP